MKSKKKKRIGIFEKSLEHEYRLNCFSDECYKYTNCNYLKGPGIYFIYSKSTNIKINSKTKNCALKSKAYSKNFLKYKLSANRSKKCILYIGKTCQTLRGRVRALYKTMFEPTDVSNLNHVGGRALSQIDNYDDLFVSFYKYSNINRSKLQEKEFKIISQYVDKYNELPFANMVF